LVCLTGKKTGLARRKHFSPAIPLGGNRPTMIPDVQRQMPCFNLEH